jgi:hypothetical protein
MDLPNKERVIVEAEKVRDYLLSEAHPDGYGKAEFFVAKGFRRKAWHVLAEALRQVARENIVMKHMTSPHGQKYIVDGILRSPTGLTALVRTVWIVDADGDTPRLVTAYPREQEHDDQRT